MFFVNVPIVAAFLSHHGYARALAGDPIFQALSPSAAREAESGLSGALNVSRTLGASGEALASSARAAFVSGLDAGMVVTAVVALIGAAIALRFIPEGEPAGSAATSASL